ncbi:hypothetical protein [Desertivirga brevis]|uniref:hypothetical protein n=1 Tax=Desertivirga brevis TaxID=2810310 RepID=UPI001A969F55|nr:hypothetical protein [Pedobacter sp. SYSU D00873]
MNYILHLNAFFKKANADPRMKAYHISLYMGIFQLWNATHFRTSFYVSRQELMELAKIGSTTTYHQYLKDLDAWNYIQYFPSKDISSGSRIRCITFATSSRTSKATSDDTNADTNNVLQLVPSNKHIETLENSTKSISIKNIKKFFEENGSTSRQAKKFIDYYEARDWMIENETVSNWEVPARSWIAKEEEFRKSRLGKSEPATKKTSIIDLTPKNKRYDEPL